jgi:hypothetical protein
VSTSNAIVLDYTRGSDQNAHFLGKTSCQSEAAAAAASRNAKLLGCITP